MQASVANAYELARNMSKILKDKTHLLQCMNIDIFINVPRREERPYTLGVIQSQRKNLILREVVQEFREEERKLV